MSFDFKDYIADIPDFPEKGIIFRDISPLIGDGEAFQRAILDLSRFAAEKEATMIAAPEARGFLVGAPVASQIGAGFAQARKVGKLPRAVEKESYDLEYGTQSTLEMHLDAIKPGQKVVVIDDLLATGGTIEATINLVERLGGDVVGVAFLIELMDLKGRDNLSDYDVYSLMQY